MLYCKLPFTAHRWQTNNRGTKHTDTHNQPKSNISSNPQKTPNSKTTSHKLLYQTLASSPLLSCPPPHPHHHCLSHQSVFPTLYFSLSCLLPGRRSRRRSWGVEGVREVGEWGVRTDEVAMVTPHWHAPDWSMWWLIIQCICLKKQ